MSAFLVREVARIAADMQCAEVEANAMADAHAFASPGLRAAHINGALAVTLSSCARRLAQLIAAEKLATAPTPIRKARSTPQTSTQMVAVLEQSIAANAGGRR